MSTPTWLSYPGPILLKRHARSSKYEPLVDEVQLVHATPNYAQVRYQDGREATVSLRDVAPFPQSDIHLVNPETHQFGGNENIDATPNIVTDALSTPTDAIPIVDNSSTCLDNCSNTNLPADVSETSPELRRSTRERRTPDRFHY